MAAGIRINGNSTYLGDINGLDNNTLIRIDDDASTIAITTGSTSSGLTINGYPQFMYGGVFTPIGVIESNIDSDTLVPREAQWSQILNVVTMSGVLDITVTNGPASTSFFLTIPTGGDFTNEWELTGIVMTRTGVSMVATAEADGSPHSGTKAYFSGVFPSAGVKTLIYTLTYKLA